MPFFGRPSCSACHGREYATRAEACGRCEDMGAQARDWVMSKCPGSVSGSNGHNAAFLAACALVGGFSLEEAEALAVMREWNALCVPPWSEGELRHKVVQAAGKVTERGYLVWKGWEDRMGGMTNDKTQMTKGGEEWVDQGAKENAREFDAAALRRVAAQAARVESEEWLARVSPVCIEAVTPEIFLSGLYRPGERVLVFTKYKSQGQFLFEVPGQDPPARTAGVWLLSPRMGEQARRAEQLPREGRCGVWFMCQPLTGGWLINRGAARRSAHGGPEYGRRHGDCVTRWPYLVLESDEEGVELEWLQFLCDLPVPIVALYTSGGRSIHALVRVDAPDKHSWDRLRTWLKPLLTKYGADKGVFSAVRLTRLPGCLRLGKETEEKGERMPDGKWKMADGTVRPRPPGVVWERYKRPLQQRLLYFNPEADGRAISTLVERSGAAGNLGEMK